MARQHIGTGEIEFSSLSMLDDSGRVFKWREGIHRAITSQSLARMDELFTSGLIARLQSMALIVGSERTDYALEGYAAVIRHETASVVSYPYEWSFEMLRKAALVVLQVNRVAMEYGYQTRDCHPYNVVFFGDQPKFVDIGSFARMDAAFARHLYSYVEFCKCYLYPLRVWALGDGFTARRFLQRWKQMTPPEAYVAYRLGGARGFVRKVLRTGWMFSHKLQAIPHLLSGNATSGRANRYRALAGALFRLGLPLRKSRMDVLERIIRGIRPPAPDSTWGDYHARFYGAGKAQLSERFRTIVGIVEKLGVTSATDIGGNQAVVSEALAAIPAVEHVNCLDSDENAIDVGYLRTSANPIAARKLRFAVLNPFYPEINWLESHPTTRFRAEVALALAITHHLVLDQGYSLDYVFRTVKSYATRYVVIEFMPLGLYSTATGSGPSVPAWYTQEWFLDEFRKQFQLMEVIPAEVNRVIVVGSLDRHDG